MINEMCIRDSFGGVAMDHFGSVGVYGLFSLFNVVGVVLYLLWGLHKPKRAERRD